MTGGGGGNPLRARVGTETIGTVAVAAVLLMGLLWFRGDAYGFGAVVILAVVGGVAVILGLLLVWLLRAGTVVSPQGITIRGLFRTEHLHWGDIQELRVEPIPGEYHPDAPAEALYAYDGSGTRHDLPYLDEKSVGSGVALEHEAEWLRGIWQQRREGG